jgi:predicted glutamine amidotransferase
MMEMFDYNSDGAGIAYVLNQRVYVEKGFMEYKDFYRALAGIEKRLRKAGTDSTQVPMAFHFRIGTHGPNSAPLTHPFPVTTKSKYFDALDYTTDIMMMHNGIITSVTPNNNVSDTVQYIRDIVYPMYRNDRKFFNNPHMEQILDNTIAGSRLLFLDKDGDFKTIGSWNTSTQAPGVMFSNLNHEYSYSAYGAYYGNRTSYSTKYNGNEYVYMRQLPDGYLRGVDKDGPIALHEIATVKNTKKLKYYVDNLGSVYYSAQKQGFVTPVIYFSTAYRDMGDNYEIVTSDDPEIMKVSPLSAKRIMEEDYDGYYSGHNFY